MDFLHEEEKLFLVVTTNEYEDNAFYFVPFVINDNKMKVNSKILIRISREFEKKLKIFENRICYIETIDLNFVDKKNLLETVINDLELKYPNFSIISFSPSSKNRKDFNVKTLYYGGPKIEENLINRDNKIIAPLIYIPWETYREKFDEIIWETALILEELKANNNATLDLFHNENQIDYFSAKREVKDQNQFHLKRFLGQDILILGNFEIEGQSKFIFIYENELNKKDLRFFIINAEILLMYFSVNDIPYIYKKYYLDEYLEYVNDFDKREKIYKDILVKIETIRKNIDSAHWIQIEQSKDNENTYLATEINENIETFQKELISSLKKQENGAQTILNKGE